MLAVGFKPLGADLISGLEGRSGVTRDIMTHCLVRRSIHWTVKVIQISF